MLSNLTFFIVRTNLLYFFKVIFTIIIMVSYVKIMINYDDFKILSPEKMDVLAKKYFEALKMPPHKSESESLLENANFLKIISSLNLVFVEISNIPNLCTKRFYYNKHAEVMKIVDKISKIVDKYPRENYRPKAQNYCSSITLCINELCLAIKNSLALCEAQNCQTLKNIAEECLKLIAMMSNLFGECKYRC